MTNLLLLGGRHYADMKHEMVSLPECSQLDSALLKRRVNFSFIRWGPLLLLKCLAKNHPWVFSVASQNTYVFLFLAVIFNTLITSHVPLIFFTEQSQLTTLQQNSSSSGAANTCPTHLLCPSALRCCKTVTACRRQISYTTPGWGNSSGDTPFRSTKWAASPRSCLSTWWLHTHHGTGRAGTKQKEVPLAGRAMHCSSPQSLHHAARRPGIKSPWTSVAVLCGWRLTWLLLF